MEEKKPKLGSGQRFKELATTLQHKGAENPAALAAYIGRKRYGQKKMTQMAEHGKKK